MKTITLIIITILLIGCSKSGLSLTKADDNPTIEIYEMPEAKTESVGSGFKYTLSSFIPTKEAGSDEGMSWMETLQNSNILYYIISIISFIIIGFLVFIGVKNKDKFKLDKSLGA